MPYSTLIISDVHLGYAGSHVREASQLEPLFEKHDRVIFNGDTVEQRHPTFREASFRLIETLRKLADSHGCATDFISGNHDPIVSEIHHIELCDGQVLVTHGDVLYESITPWSRHHKKLKAQFRHNLQDLSLGEYEVFERHLRATKKVALMVSDMPMLEQKGPASIAFALLSEIFPFWRPFFIVHAWRTSSARAFETLQRFRPNARFIIFGHVHFPGVWRNAQGQIAINTGSFTPVFGCQAVRIADGNRLEVFKLRRSSGRYDLAEPIPEASFDLAQTISA